jgi:hypothetical protein
MFIAFLHGERTLDAKQTFSAPHPRALSAVNQRCDFWVGARCAM